MRHDKGTPKTLIEAIQNGLGDGNPRNHEEASEIIRLHVKDFLAQHFMTAGLLAAKKAYDGDQIIELFHRLTKK